MSTNSKETPLADEDIEELAKFFDLLAQFDFEDKKREPSQENQGSAVA